MNYPQYTNIIQICFLPDNEMKMPNDMFEWVDNEHQGKIFKTILSSNLCWEPVMDCYISNCKERNDIPILHLDMHGDKDGFGKDPNEIIGWDRLVKKISELNQACNGRLFLSLNVCKGLQIYNNIVNCNSISLQTIGSNEDVNAGDGKRRFLKLYLEYFTGKDMNNAINAFFDEPKLYPEHGSFELKY